MLNTKKIKFKGEKIMAGIILKADESGISIMNSMADGVEEGADNIIEQTENFLEEVSQYPALGPHKESIERVVEAIQEKTKGTTAPARVVAEKLRSKAKEYQEWIDDDMFGSGSGN